MALIQCPGCDAAYESTLAACPVCGRCPRCARRRAPHLGPRDACPGCGAPYCPGCGRCHACGAVRLVDLGACECGHPKDPEVLASLEEHFGDIGRGRSGCVAALALACGLSALGGWAVRNPAQAEAPGPRAVGRLPAGASPVMAALPRTPSNSPGSRHGVLDLDMWNSR